MHFCGGVLDRDPFLHFSLDYHTLNISGVGNEESVPTEIVMTISAIFIIIAILIVIVFVIRFKRARDAARSKCTAPNNTKMNGDTTMTGAHVGNPYGTIQRCGSRTSRPINNGFATLEQHPHNTLRYNFFFDFFSTLQCAL